jgi:metal-sulfur cluster biosynthetic enzyme
MKATNDKQNIVKIMRKIRDKISLDIIDMSLVQENEFLKRQLSELKSKNC